QPGKDRQQNGERHELAARERRFVEGDAQEVEVMNRQRLVGVPDDVEEGDQDRGLQQRRQATAHLRQRVDVVLLVERHRLLVQALRILLVLFTDGSQLRRDPTLLRLDPARGRQLELEYGGEDQLDHDGEQDDGDAKRTHGV